MELRAHTSSAVCLEWGEWAQMSVASGPTVWGRDRKMEVPDSVEAAVTQPHPWGDDVWSRFKKISNVYLALTTSKRK